MRILVSGASGFIGSSLLPRLQALGHQAIPLPRGRAGEKAPPWWDPARGAVELGAEPFHAIFHLAGENIMGRWSEDKKRRVTESRVQGTALLAAAASRLVVKPSLFLSASAIGIYGNRGDQWVDETTPRGSGFLADVCEAWERAAAAAKEAGLRVAFPRFGLVLGKEGGALARMLPAFRLGLGGPLGQGAQYWSWIAMDDLVESLIHILLDERLAGPVNIVAPHPATNQEFTRTLAQVLNRPAFFRVPAFMLKLAFGREMAKETFLSSVRVQPKVLEEHGYKFKLPKLEPALRHLLAQERLT